MIDLTNFEQQEKYNTDNFSWKYYKIMNKSNGTKHFAKVFKSFSENFNKRMETAFFNEILINSKLNHPSIIKFIGYSLMDFKNRSKPVIILEYASNKLLEDYFYEESDLNISNFSDTQKLIIIYGIASGMSYLHSHDVIHRSLNPRNIFIDEFYHPKITDFDFAIEITDNYIQNERIQGFTLTHELDYFAPETLTSCKFSKFSDVYSFSLIMYQIFTNKKPFNSFIRKLGGFNDINERPTFDEPICDAYKNLIERCWSTDPQLRPTLDQIINELKTNNEFITDKIDKEEYFKYIRQLEEFPASFESTNKIQIRKFKKNKKKILI